MYDNDKTSSRSRKLAKQRAVPVGTTSAVQFSEKCLRQEGGGVNVDGEIIFQAPLPGTDGSASIDVCANENSEGDLLAEVQAHESPLNEETSSFLNVAAPEFVPELAPAEMKDEEEENVAVSSNSDVSSSQSAHPHKHRHFNKHQPYQQYPMIPDYSMLRGPIPSHLPLPYPYYVPRHPREPLIPLGMPFGYPYPPMQLQQSRMFPDGFPGRHPQVYTAGMPSEIYMMEFGGPFPQDIQNRLYSWTGVPEQTGQSPEPEHEVQDSPDGMQENTSPTANIGDTVEPRLQDNVTSLESDGDQFPVTNLSDNTSQFSTKIESNDLHYDDTGDSNIDNDKASFSEEVHPIKDNSTGQVVDTGYIHKHVDSSQSDDETPSAVTSKALPEYDDSAKDNLESNSERAEVMELSQEGPPADNTVQQDEEYAATTTVEICDVTKLPEDTESVQTEQAVAEITKPEPQPTITPICVGSDVKVVPEEKPAATSPPLVTKKLPSTTLGNKLNEPKTKAPPVTQQHKVDRRTSNSNNNLRTSNQFSSSRENSYSRTDSQTFTSSGKMSSKGSTKSGPNIILRAPNAPEKKTYQQSYHAEPATAYTTGSKDTNHSSSSSAASVASEVKKSHSNSSTHSVSKEANNSSPANSSNTTVQCNTQAEVKKPPAWGQTKKWSQLFNNNSSSKETAVSPNKDPVAQGDPMLSSSSETVTDQIPPNPEHINKQLKSLGGKGKMLVFVLLEMCMNVEAFLPCACLL